MSFVMAVCNGNSGYDSYEITNDNDFNNDKNNIDVNYLTTVITIII